MWFDANLQTRLILLGHKAYTIRLLTQFRKEGDTYGVRVTARYRGDHVETVTLGGCLNNTKDVSILEVIRRFADSHDMPDLAIAKLKATLDREGITPLDTK